MIALVAAAAEAASCSCSVGGGDATFPAATVPPAGRVQVSAAGGVRQTGGEPWEGFVPAIDRGGDSMPEMAMPGHLEHTVRLGVLVGLPRGFAVTAAAPWIHTAPLAPSDMPGDEPRGLVGDARLAGRYARRVGDTIAGASLGTSLPTGRVVRGSGVRGGRGAVGLEVEAEVLRLVLPVLGLGARASGAASLYRSPVDGYTVGPDLEVAGGTRVWPREQGRVSFVGAASYLRRGRDRSGGEPLADTGVDVLRLLAGVDATLAAYRSGSIALSLSGQAPVAQVVGDPWLAENWTLGAGLTASW